ncbi:MAG: hypothetical protein IIB06_01420 [Bacteroidetes bacterium]|nr:hypothetical protein [Bacteroidota bacterium]
MKLIKYFLLFFSLCLCFNINAQSTNDTIVKKHDVDEIFTSGEKDNLHMWFQDEVDEMNLTGEKEKAYVDIVIYYIPKMRHLRDKDKGYSNREYLVLLDELLLKQNKEMITFLTDEEYLKHLVIFNTLLKSINNKLEEE